MLWRRLDQPGHESGRLLFRPPNWHLTGTAVFSGDGRPCRLDYLVVCDSRWHTVSARVAGWVANASVDIELLGDDARQWRVNGAACPEVAGCIDLDLGFSPSTNLLPIRRLGLAVGQQAEVKAAWLPFPALTLRPLGQVYRRLDATTYRYESGGGRFVTELTVDGDGFVTRYPNFWQMEATA